MKKVLSFLVVFTLVGCHKYYDMTVERTFKEGKKDTVQIWDAQSLVIRRTKEGIQFLSDGPKNRGVDVVAFRYLKKIERKDH